VQASQVLPHLSRQTISVWTLLSAQGHCHAEEKFGSTESSRMSLYAVELTFPFNGTKGPRAELVGKVASYDGATLKVTELFGKAIDCTANVCRWKLHACVLDFIHLSATCVADIAKSTNWKVSTYFCIYSVFLECSFKSPLSFYFSCSEISYWFTVQKRVSKA
jgi:hypothetical protein